jgi:hypothetical protein
VKLSEKLAK